MISKNIAMIVSQQDHVVSSILSVLGFCFASLGAKFCACY